MTREKTIESYFVLRYQSENAAFDDGKHIVLLTFDDNYVNQTINLILSISKFHKNEISYVCLCPVLKPKSIDALLCLAEGIQVRCYDFLSTIDPGAWPVCAMFRLFAPWLLAENVHKVLYMDSDIICAGNIEKLLKMETPYIAMCPEIAGNIQPRQQHVIQQFLPVQVYCNSGVCLLNLDALRKTYSAETIIDSLREMRPKLGFPDQDFLNFYFKGKIEVLNNYMYNLQPYELKKSIYYKRILNNCKLLHFSLCKPWTHHCELHLIYLYLKYTEYPPMRAMVKRALWKSYFHSVIRLNRPIRRWYNDTFLCWRKNLRIRK